MLLLRARQNRPVLPRCTAESLLPMIEEGRFEALELPQANG
jgi:hypothetical protein